ncbi:MAG: HNH endonuclease [Chloroflexi bacterium]|nr:HNH endonuclease [Chloroflexota bacterium]
MPLLSKSELLDTIVSAIVDSGWNVLYLSGPEHPFQLQVYRQGESYRILVYIWNISHGGGAARPADEYRIQVTGTNHFQQQPGVKTLVLGWWQEIGVFAGFDVRKHSGVLGFSPSLQIRKPSLEQAAQTGFAPYDKGNQEIAIAFRPDFFGEYVRSLESLHDFGQSSQDLAALETVSQQPDVNTAELPVTSQARRTTVTSVSRKLRDAKFRKSVLAAYSYRCAFCGLQLNLTDAAHIVPVTHESSVDRTFNGLALCALHHRAFDQSLVTLWEDYSVRCSEEQVARLTASARHGGLQGFKEGLYQTIALPNIVSDRPHVDCIKLGNEIRGWLTRAT